MEIAKLVVEFIRVLAWPLTVIFLAVLFRKSLRGLLARLVKAGLPGGVSLDFRDQIQQAQNLSEKVLESSAPESLQAATLISTNEVNKKLIMLGLEPVRSGLDPNFFKSLANSDPTLALAALRMDLETLARNLINACSLPIEIKVSAMRMVRELAANKAITQDQADLALRVLKICNRVIHGHRIERVDAGVVIESAAILFGDFRKWLSTK